jgi:L-rhamnose isomerase
MDSGDDESSHYDYDSDDESSHYDDDSDDEKLEPKMIRAKRLAKKLDAIEKEINSIEIGTQGTQKKTEKF